MKLMSAFLAAALVVASAVSGAAAGPTGEFSMIARVDTPQGTRTMPCTIVVTRPIPYEDAVPHRKLLEEGGQQAVLAAIRGGSRGMLSLGGFEAPLDLVVYEPKGDGFRYVVVTARPIRWDESEEGKPSLDYPFSVLVFESPGFGLGEGQIVPRAALEIDEEGHTRAIPFEGRMGVLKEVRRK